MTDNPFVLPEGKLPDPYGPSIVERTSKVYGEQNSVRNETILGQMKRFGWPTTIEYITGHVSFRHEPVEGRFGSRTRFFHDGQAFLVESTYTETNDDSHIISFKQEFEFFDFKEADREYQI